jgi:transcription termination/antitermination protein NusG
MEIKTKRKRVEKPVVEKGPDPNATNWYTLKVQANKERSIMTRMKSDAERGEISLDNIIVPIERVLMLKQGKKYNRDKVIYPGYIFLETKHLGEMGYYIKGLSGATGFVKDMNGDPIYMRKKEVERMLHDLDKKEEVDNTRFVESETVVISAGPFSGFSGEITEINQDKNKVKVAVKIFGRITSVDLEISQIDKKNDNVIRQ